MDSMESCVPPGFRFHPTDEGARWLLPQRKVASQRLISTSSETLICTESSHGISRSAFHGSFFSRPIKERCRIGYEEQTEWYFFSHKDKKYPTGTRTNRATVAGFWKATGRDKAVHDKNGLIGMRKTLVFYKGRAPNGQKTDWIMHEYRLDHESASIFKEKNRWMKKMIDKSNKHNTLLEKI
ncbi:hypothetical protein HPP92_007354 [Vanilla planifolia]|uniref:NAC domain-containing protein n=1 Tax=Vanilla planifolia TaxID=51239 RepID=A0A835V8L9_VANPL|nr:hypothetical protein HPP92_007354 [Vanilla planifolia]